MNVTTLMNEIGNYSDNNDTVIFQDVDVCNSYLNNVIANLKLIHLNIHSINKNFSEFCIMLQSFEIKFDIIILTEVWLEHDTGYNLAGYNKYAKTNKYNKCDEILVYRVAGK
ncbi:hypothetical protein C0J52_07491 [Blattella germanica]|nr:hypothetical protein C0J52_07491 [Blattella germanica]